MAIPLHLVSLHAQHVHLLVAHIVSPAFMDMFSETEAVFQRHALSYTVNTALIVLHVFNVYLLLSWPTMPVFASQTSHHHLSTHKMLHVFVLPNQTTA